MLWCSMFQSIAASRTKYIQIRVVVNVLRIRKEKYTMLLENKFYISKNYKVC